MRHETGFRIDAVAIVRLAGVASGTRVLTPTGEVPVETLRRGDSVTTRSGPMRVIVAEARSARVTHIRIAAQSLGLRMPGRELVLGLATRLWLPRQSRPLEAHRLIDGAFVTEDQARLMGLWTLVFPSPQVVRMEGVEVCV